MKSKHWKTHHYLMGLSGGSLLLGLGVLHSVQADGIYTPKAMLNQQPGERLQVHYQGDVKQPADLYLAVEFQQQLLFFTEHEGLSFNARPLLRQEGFFAERVLLDIESKQIPVGQYQIYQVLTRANSDVFDLNNWLSELNVLNFIVGEAQTPSHDAEVNPTSPTPPTPPASNAYPDGARLLASQCFQCHGTEGISITGIESLREESNEIAEEMFEMKYSNQTNDIMHRHAMGYSDAEIRSIDAYFRALYGAKR